MDHPELYLNCSCSSLDHMVRFQYWPDDGYVTVDVVLSQERSFWQRIVTAMKYVLRGRTCRYGTVAEVVVDEHDLVRLKEWLAEVK